MKRPYVIVIKILVIVILVLSGIHIASYFGWLANDMVEPGTIVTISDLGASVDHSDTTSPFTIEVVAQNLFVPWSIVFTDPNRLLVTERSGTIRVVYAGTLQPEPLHVFNNISTQSEEGLMSMALDPAYAENKFIYVCVAYDSGFGLVDKVIRFHDAGSELTKPRVLIDNIPAAQYHAGCRLKFGPDKKLYITTGDATTKEIAQDINSLGGKILRINADGSIPDDNPFLNSPVYSFGHRNPQGIAWHPVSGVLISTEHGPSVNDGPAGGDEINRIIAGGNYGWPLVSHDKNEVGLIAPLVQFTPAVAPGSALIYGGDVFPDWYGSLFFGALKGEGIVRVTFTDDSATAIATYEQLNIDVGRVRDVVQGPDGYIYFTTSNQDGRGEVRDGDDKIYRIVPTLNNSLE